MAFQPGSNRRNILQIARLPGRGTAVQRVDLAFAVERRRPERIL